MFVFPSMTESTPPGDVPLRLIPGKRDASFEENLTDGLSDFPVFCIRRLS